MTCQLSMARDWQWLVDIRCMMACIICIRYKVEHALWLSSICVAGCLHKHNARHAHHLSGTLLDFRRWHSHLYGLLAGMLMAINHGSRWAVASATHTLFQVLQLLQAWAQEVCVAIW